MNLQIYRNESPHITIPIDENTVYRQVVMGEHLISCSFISATPLDIDEGDYIIFRGDRFTINRPLPPFEKSSNFTYKYDLEFEGYVYDLLDMPIMHLGDLEFSYFGDPTAFLQIIVDCMNEVGSGWSIGEVAEVPEKPIDFYESGKGYSCKGALIKISETFELEFWLTGKTINLTAQAGVQTSLFFEYGRGKGLYKMARGKIDDQPYFNRLYIQGGDKNIPSTYRNGAGRLRLDQPFIQAAIAPGKRVRAESVVLDDIFPKRTGTVSAVSIDWLKVTDSSIDFDLNGQKIQGTEPYISFTSGECSGKNFEIDSYNHATKTLTLLPITEKDGYVYPNATFEIKANDKYVIYGIVMPSTYFEAAETDLRSEGLKLLSKAKNTPPPYAVEVDEKYMRDNGIMVSAGDRVKLVDSAMNIDQPIRVSSVQFPLVNPDKINLVISDVITLNSIEQAIVVSDKVKRDTVTVRKVSAENARRNMMNVERLKSGIFDPDGFFDTEKIKPFSIDTYMLSVGAKSQNFALSGVFIDTNYQGNPNHMIVSQGSLIHFQIEIDGLGFIWQVDGAEFPTLDPNKQYYLSAKCRKTALTGEWVLSETPIKAEEETGYYHFNVGIVYAVDNGQRGYDFTNGMTFILGDQITTGTIKSLDGLNFMNLTTGQFKLGDDIHGLDYNVSESGRLTIKGGITQNAGGIQAPIPVFRGPYNPTNTYYDGDTVTNAGSQWAYINPAPSSGNTPVEGEYWTVIAKSGTNGTNGTNGISGNYTEFRFAVNGSTTVSPDAPDNVNDPSGWTTSQPSVGAGQYLWAVNGIKSGEGNLIGAWSTPVRFTAADGTNGTDGDDAPYLISRGVYDPDKTYVGNTTRIEAVQYLGDWYVTRTDAGTIAPGTLPTDTDYFNTFGGQFESVATGLLLADLAYITNLGVRNLATDTEGNKRVEINGVNNNVRFLNGVNKILVEIDDDSALEGFTITPNDPPLPPTVTPVYGPGIRVGTVMDADGYGYSSMGRTGVASDAGLQIYKKGTIDKMVNVDTDANTILLNSPTTINQALKANSFSVYNSDGSTNAGISGRFGYTAQVTGGTQTRHMIFKNGILIEEGIGL